MFARVRVGLGLVTGGGLRSQVRLAEAGQSGVKGDKRDKKNHCSNEELQ
jgi:hypothetical protein